MSFCHCTYTHPPTNNYDVKIFHFGTVTVHIPTQKAMMSKYFILRSPTHPSDISKVPPCHCTYTHPPTKIMMSKYFILRTPTHPLNISKVSTYHCTYTHPPTNILCQNISISEHINPSDISKVSLCHCTHTHPPTKSYDVKIFHFKSIHSPIRYILSVTLSLYVCNDTTLQHYTDSKF